MYRSWPLGHGAYRLGGNIGPVVAFLQEAQRNGFDDVAWLLDDYVEDLTFTNFAVFLRSRFGYDELVTPPLDGLIYDSQVLRTLLDMKDQIQDEMKVRFVERQLSVHELISAQRELRLKEMLSLGFNPGVLSLVQVVDRLAFKNHVVDLGGAETPMADYLTGTLRTAMTTKREWLVQI